MSSKQKFWKSLLSGEFLFGDEKKAEARVISQKEIKAPDGYVELKLKGIDFDELKTVHNINCKYMETEDGLFIKSIVMLNDGCELNCFHLGENKLVEILKNNSISISLIVTEINGLRNIIYIKNGKSL